MQVTPSLAGESAVLGVLEVEAAAGDLDPASGRARLSYEMAEQLFKRYSGGKTLHQLRHSRLTHLGDKDVSAPLLMALSGHKRLATLQRYVKPARPRWPRCWPPATPTAADADRDRNDLLWPVLKSFAAQHQA
jgi:integrase